MIMPHARNWFWTIALRTVLLAIPALMASAVGLYYYWAFLDVHPPVRITGEDRAVNPEVERGGALFIARNFCIERPPLHIGSLPNCAVHRRIVDTIVLNYPVTSGARDVGCAENRVYGTELPSLIPNGRYRFEETWVCEINPLTNREVRFPSVEFEIIDGADRPPRHREIKGG